MVVAATGFFDGVHLGHQAVIKTLLDYAKQHNGQSLVISFLTHPRVVLQKDARNLRLLSSQHEKVDLLTELGVDRVEILAFTKEFAALDAKQYLQFLKDNYGVQAIVLGYDNSFGAGKADTEKIKELAENMGIEVLVQGALKCENYTISSTACRNALMGGEVELASKMLGRDYSLSGVVVSGKQLGRTIGYPTANLRLREPLKCVPAVGVYLSRVRLGGAEYWGMSNVDRSSLIETHIFDFDEDIYGMDLEISFHSKIRDEIKFSSVKELKNQLKIDEISAKKRIFAEVNK